MTKKQKKVNAADKLAHFVKVLQSAIDDEKIKNDLQKQFIQNEELNLDETEAVWCNLHATFMFHANAIKLSSANVRTENNQVSLGAVPTVNTIDEPVVTVPLETDPNDLSQSYEYILAVVHIIYKTYSLIPEGENNVDIPSELLEIVKYLPRFLMQRLTPLFEIKEQIVFLAELILKKTLELRAGMSMLSFEYLLDLTDDKANKSVLKLNVERVWKFRNALYVLNLESSGCKSLVHTLTQLPKNKFYLRYKEGRNFISFLFTINKNIVNLLHNSVKDILPLVKQSQATHFGDIYSHAWLTASPALRGEIENTCIENFMPYSFVLPRQGLERGKLGCNVLIVLEAFHKKRKRPDVSRMLANLYEPLMWRYLTSSSNIHRCNAAEVFFSAYPLLRPGSGGQAREDFEFKQHEAITAMLIDSCPVVRVQAIKGVCKVLRLYWVNLPAQSVKQWVSILVNDLALDSSRSEVRRHVFLGILEMLETVPVKHLSDQIKKLAPQLHDVSEDVRKSFIRLLMKLKEKGERFWDYVSPNHLVARLEMDTPAVCELIVSLMFSYYYCTNKASEECLKRLFYLVLLNQGASRNLFFYSKKTLPPAQAIDLINTILHNLHAHVKAAIEMNVSVDCSPIVHNLRPNKRSGQPVIDKENLNTFNEPGVSVEKPEDLYGKMHFKNPLVAQRMLDIAIILWQEHVSNTTDDREETYVFKMAASCMQQFMLYYKDSIVYNSVLQLASFVPLSVIGPTFHVASLVMSQLKKLTANDSHEEILAYVIPLCRWNRGGDILELSQDWLREAFASGDANLVRNRSLRKRVVFKPQQEPKPHLALLYLNALFSYSSNQQTVMIKDYGKVMDLWIEVASVKGLIIDRLKRNEPLASQLLNDALLQGCLRRYAKLILILRCDEPQFDSCKQYILLLKWSQESVMVYVPGELPDKQEVPLSVSMLLDLVTIGHEMMDLTCQDPEFCFRMAAFIKVLLNTGCGLMFVHSASLVINLLCKIAKKSGKSDPMRLARVAIPSLTAAILTTLTNQCYSSESLAAHVQSFSKVKDALLSALLIIESFYGTSSKPLEQLLAVFADSLVNLTANIRDETDITDDAPMTRNALHLDSQLINIFTSKASRGDAFVETLRSRLKASYNQQESLKTAYISLLRILVSCPKKMSKEQLIMALTEAEELDTPGNTSAQADISNISTALHGMELRDSNGSRTLVENVSNSANHLL